MSTTNAIFALIELLEKKNLITKEEGTSVKDWLYEDQQ